MTVNNSSLSAASGTFNTNVSLNEGSNTISISAKDDYNTANTVTLEVIRDTTPPKFVSVDGDRLVSSEGEEFDITIRSGQNSNIVIEDSSGIKEVKLNDSPLKIDVNKKSLTIQVSDGDLKQKNGTLTASDNVGNESSKTIIVIPEPPEEILKLVKDLFNRNKYDEASKLLDEISKSKDPVPGMPLVNFYRGLISFKRGEKNKSFEDSDKDYETTVSFLKYSLPDIGQYPAESMNAEYHRYYLGMAYYKRWLVLKQSPGTVGDRAKQAERDTLLASLLNNANDTLKLFVNSVEGSGTANRISTMYDQAKRILTEISKTQAGGR